MNFKIGFEFVEVHVVCCELFDEVIHEYSHEGLFCGKGVCSIVTIISLFYFYELNVAEWDSENGRVPHWSVACGNGDGAPDVVKLG